MTYKSNLLFTLSLILILLFSSFGPFPALSSNQTFELENHSVNAFETLKSHYKTRMNRQNDISELESEVLLSNPQQINSFRDNFHSNGLPEGNTISNSVNLGLLAQQGDWIYYINESHNDALYKLRTDGTEKQRIF